MSTKVPSIPAPTSGNLLQVAQAVKTLLDVREGAIGDPLDASVTFRDLIDSGIATKKSGLSAGSTVLPVLPAWSNPDGYDPTKDMTTPIAPVNVTATSGMTSIILQWDSPAYRNHSYAEVWRSPTNVIGNAVLLGTSDTRFYTDAVGKTSQTYYYWVRFVSQANVFGPYNAINGLSSSTGLVGGVDLSDLIITADKLAANAVESGKIKDFAVTTTKIANLAVGNAAIANLAVTNAKIADLAVDNAKIASLDAAKITTGFLSADRIQAGTLDAKIANIDAAVITSGTIASARIGSLDASKITSGTIDAARIGASSITADKINVASLSAISANLGSVTAGSISINNKFIVDSAGNATIRSGTTGARVEITNTYIKVFDSSGTLRVQIGDLAA